MVHNRYVFVKFNCRFLWTSGNLFSWLSFSHHLDIFSLFIYIRLAFYFGGRAHLWFHTCNSYLFHDLLNIWINSLVYLIFLSKIFWQSHFYSKSDKIFFSMFFAWILRWLYGSFQQFRFIGLKTEFFWKFKMLNLVVERIYK